MYDTPQLASRRIYTGRVINLDIDTVRFPDGSQGDLEMVRHSGACAVVPFVSDPFGATPQVLLIRQYRYAANQVLYEIPAGRLALSESPVDCARRELLEETGYRASELKKLYTMYSTPGFTDERIHLFMAWGLKQGSALLESDEFIEPEVLSLEDALTRVKDGEISDAKTALGLMFVAGFLLAI